MIIAVCDPKGIAIEAIKTILYHDKGLSDRISRIYEFWNMEQLLDASRDSSFDCIVFPNYCNSHNSVVCSLSCGYNRFPLVEHDPRYTLIVRDIHYWETARSLWTQYLKAIPGKEEKVKRAIRGILADYEKEERDIIYLESKNHCVLVHLDGIRQTPEGSPSFYATLDEAEHEFASSAFLRMFSIGEFVGYLIRCLIAPAFVWFSDILIGLPDNLIQAIAAVWLVVMSIFVPAVVERTIDGF